MFDWIAFLESRRIYYVTSGPNVAKGRVAIKCPFCGADDKSEHMGIDLHHERWGCWRSADHRGGSPVRLVAALAQCSLDQAYEITGKQRFIPEDYHARALELLSPKEKRIERKPLALPAEFKRFAMCATARPFISYLENERRGAFQRRDILRFTEDFGIYYAMRGPYRYRVIFTIVVNGKLQCWTGRTINPNQLRYKALSTDADKAKQEGSEPALAATADLLLWYDDLMKEDADTIVLCEGPFDALKVRLLGRERGITATCFFTMNSTESQASLLYDLLPRFKRRLLLLDQGTIPNALKLRKKLIGLDVEIAQLPPLIKDPALLTNRKQLLSVLQQNA